VRVRVDTTGPTVLERRKSGEDQKTAVGRGTWGGCGRGLWSCGTIGWYLAGGGEVRVIASSSGELSTKRLRQPWHTSIQLRGAG
jgi:hypothetical protein